MDKQLAHVLQRINRPSVPYAAMLKVLEPLCCFLFQNYDRMEFTGLQCSWICDCVVSLDTPANTKFTSLPHSNSLLLPQRLLPDNSSRFGRWVPELVQTTQDCPHHRWQPKRVPRETLASARPATM